MAASRPEPGEPPPEDGRRAEEASEVAIRLSVGIMAHPSRAEMASRLRDQLGEATDVTLDPEPDGPRNPWRCARAAWANTPPGCTHRLVMQEDTIPCRDFLHHARRALAAKPDRVASFYLGTNATQTWRRMLIAVESCEAWVEGFQASWCPALALAMPVELVPSLVAFDDGTRPVADDEVYGRWCRENRWPWYATIPSLVNHDDDAPSLMRDPYTRGSRVAACWVGSVDAHRIDWTRG